MIKSSSSLRSQVLKKISVSSPWPNKFLWCIFGW